MKIAYIILAHKYPEQLIRLVLRLNHNDASFFIHVDKKTPNDIYKEITKQLSSMPNIYLLKRHTCYWGDFNIVKATCEGIKELVKSGINFDYAILLSGQDYLIKSISQIEEVMHINKGKEFMEFFSLNSKNRWSDQGGKYQGINRIKYWHFYFRSKRFCFPKKREFPRGFEPYGGSQWWCLSKACIEYIDNFIERNSAFVDYFKYVFIPDEIFFQTIVLNSPFKENVINDDLRYMDWENPNPTYPAIMLRSDLDKLSKSSKLFARKFDITRDTEILDMIDRQILRLEF